MKVKIQVTVDSVPNTMSKRKIEKPQQSHSQQRRGRQHGLEDYNGPRGRPRGGRRGRKKINNPICVFYMQGKCLKRPEECVYSHNADPPKKMELCKYWSAGCCFKGQYCLYLHNNFPCKFFHTGHLCKQAEKCKFSHEPLNEITKTLLLKHIETSPKEILGDLPRLNPEGALTLINKTESKIREPFAEQERQKEKDKDPPRRKRTRWGQPPEDQGNLQEQIEQVQIGGYYHETLERPGLLSVMGEMQFIPAFSTPGTPSHIPRSEMSSKQEAGIPATLAETPCWNTNIANARNAAVKEPSNILHDPQEHLQKEWFLRIQEQQFKNECKSAYSESDEDEKPVDDKWYSSDEDNGKSGGFKENSSEGQEQSPNLSQTQPNLDLSSVISSIRTTIESPKTNTQTRLRNGPNATLRTTASYGGGQSQPFGDIDYRVPMPMPTGRPNLRDIDFKMTSSQPVLSVPSTNSNPLTFSKLRSGPSAEIDASVNSHLPIQYKLKVVLGVKKPDYRYVRHIMTPTQLLLDPRLRPRTGNMALLLASPSSSSSQSPVSYDSPVTIPVSDNVIMDHSNRRGSNANTHAQQQYVPDLSLPPSQRPGLLGDPMCPKDPRSIQIDVRWPSQATQYTNAHSRSEIPPLFPNFPNLPRFPNSFSQSDFSSMIHGRHGQAKGRQGRMGHYSRQQNGQDRRRPRRPVSSWERYSQHRSDQDGPLWS